MNDTNMIQRMAEELGFGQNPKIQSDWLLKFSPGNAKLENIWNISIPAGHTCPFAKQCLSRTTLSAVNPSGFGVEDGPNCEWRCFTATDEGKYPEVRRQRWFNYLLIQEQKTVEDMANLIERSLPRNKWGAPIRIHVSGDFFSLMYFDAWMLVASRNPKQVFYAYTKALPLWVKRLGTIPNNLVLTASFGGTHDHLIAEKNLRFAKVVFRPEDAVALGLEIDHDDSHAYTDDGKSFALLLHGTQPKGSEAAKAWSTLKKQGKGGYGKQKAGRSEISTVGVPSPTAGV